MTAFQPADKNGLLMDLWGSQPSQHAGTPTGVHSPLWGPSALLSRYFLTAPRAPNSEMDVERFLPNCLLGSDLLPQLTEANLRLSRYHLSGRSSFSDLEDEVFSHRGARSGGSSDSGKYNKEGEKEPGENKVNFAETCVDKGRNDANGAALSVCRVPSFGAQTTADVSCDVVHRQTNGPQGKESTTDIRTEHLGQVQASPIGKTHQKYPLTINPTKSNHTKPDDAPKKHDRRRGHKTNTQLYKTELCASYMRIGSCPYDGKCQFAHGNHELKVVERPPKWRSKPCVNWAKFGACRYGTRCCFKHE